MKIHLANGETEAQLWQQFVENHAECCNYHRWGWKRVIENSFHWRTYYLMSDEGNSVHGILPLVWQLSYFLAVPKLWRGRRREQANQGCVGG